MAEPMVPGFLQAEFPYTYRSLFTDDPEELAQLCIKMLRAEIESQGPDTVAGVIAEPVIGSGGVIVPPASFWPSLRKLCDDFELLLISDEVITGLGRAGSLFGARAWGVKPDFMSLAKGLTNGYVPMGATLIGRSVAGVWEQEGVPAQMMHGYTYSGHPLASAAALASIEIVLREDLPANAATVGSYFLGKLQQLQDQHSTIGEARGMGLMLALELVKDKKTKEPYGPNDSYPQDITKSCIASGVVLRCAGNKLILSPPLTFQREHVDEVIEVLDKSFASQRAA
jgi:adenosylmethionine-8-amino-7-oxononanoate aminotransferase